MASRILSLGGVSTRKGLEALYELDRKMRRSWRIRHRCLDRSIQKLEKNRCINRCEAWAEEDLYSLQDEEDT